VADEPVKPSRVDPYTQWRERKASAMSRPILSCGCRNDGRLTFIRGTCDCIVCGRHRGDEHEHAEEPKQQVEALRLEELAAITAAPFGLYHVTEADESHATLTPAVETEHCGDFHVLMHCEVSCDCPKPAKPPRTPWWKLNTWRRNG
jgi:hypothetical protein